MASRINRLEHGLHRSFDELTEQVVDVLFQAQGDLQDYVEQQQATTKELRALIGGLTQQGAEHCSLSRKSGCSGGASDTP